MKIVSLLAGVGVAAVLATTASAQAITETNYVNPANNTNTGVVDTSLSATFGVSGSVAASCVLGNGDNALASVAFGTLGIYGDASNGIDNAFELVGPRNGNSSTNSAGCNTSNRVTVTKLNGSQGLLNADANTAGYDPNVFQGNLPYSLGALYTAGNVGQIGVSGSLGKFTVDTTEATDSRQNNAWRSSLAIRVDIPVPTKALVAGTYSDTVTVTIETL